MYDPVSQRIKFFIEEHLMMSVNSFAKTLEGVSQQSINRLFNEDPRSKKYPKPSHNMIKAITNAYVTLNPDWLLHGKGDMLQTTGEYVTNEAGFVANEPTAGNDGEFWRRKYEELSAKYMSLLEEKLEEWIEFKKSGAI